MRTAIVHYWMLKMRGGEKVVEALCEMYPDADIFTHVYDPRAVSDTIRKHKVVETSIARLPFARKHYQKYLPFMPRALEDLDLSGYDLVISSESGPAKGVIPSPDAQHVCYTHSPMRYIWDQQHEYMANSGRLVRTVFPGIAHTLRQWDVTAAARVDHFVANSNHVARRVERFWRRDAEVIHPPVDVEGFAPPAGLAVGDYYLAAGELVAYKRFDLVAEAFARMKRKLVIIGEGEQRAQLEKRFAGGTVKFLGRVGFDDLKRCMAEARALVFPGLEDFGIIPVESMAAGRPVIAYGRAGVLDSVKDGETGLFFDEQSVDSVIDAVERFEGSWGQFERREPMMAHARTFSRDVFKQKMGDLFTRIGRPPPASVRA
ncbi:glycosyltransferase [bacterium]|nr:glycosyltransferase [bacterium]